MPANYHSILGYGSPFNIADIPEDVLKGDEWLGQDFHGTIEGRYPNLAFEAAGDMWNSNKEFPYVFAKSSVLSHRSTYGDRDGWGKEVSLPNREIPRNEIEELWKFFEDLHLPGGNMSWHLLNSVT